MDFFLGQATGFVLGLAGSLLTWWVLTHWISPSIAFGEFISRRPYDEEGKSNAYRVKVANVGRRDLMDGYVIAILSIKGLRQKTNWTSFRIPLNWEGETSVTIPVMRSKTNRVYRLCLDISNEIRRSLYLPSAIRQKAEEGTLTLEDMLSFEKSRLRVYLIGSDALSGARKVFQSKDYQLADIIGTTFKGLGPNPDMLEAGRRPAPAAEPEPPAPSP